MSTFDGVVSEFPLILIDRFRGLPGRTPPLAGFLSHVHSDHLIGLESLKSPFVYCSAATRELVLRLEKFPHRMNFARGILECRKQTYRHLSKLLKPLPLDTATTIQLSPGNIIRVTLIDANHCVGAVMFLIEGNGKAVLYTGDIRAETWWVNGLTRHPSMIKYTLQPLDQIYLDTTFAVKTDQYREFPSKAAGVKELLQKVGHYPDTTVFYFNAWTFGYEDVWRTLSGYLHSKVHLDGYRYNMYTSIAKGNKLVPEAAALCGFAFGNDYHPGILTKDEKGRLHSCESGSGCSMGGHSRSDLVTITPILSRFRGNELHELGAGGGKGDLDPGHELEFTGLDDLQRLLSMCSETIKDEEALAKVAKMLAKAMASEEHQLTMDDLDDFTLSDSDEIPLTNVPDIIARLISRQEGTCKADESDIEKATINLSLPSSITFPYSRHSSYNELRELVAAFRPRQVWPCTAPPLAEGTETLSAESLFGDLCSNDGEGFLYDNMMRNLRADVVAPKRKRDGGDDEGGEDNSQSARHVETHLSDDGDDDDDGTEDFQDAQQSLSAREVMADSQEAGQEELANPPMARTEHRTAHIGIVGKSTAKGVINEAALKLHGAYSKNMPTNPRRKSSSTPGLDRKKRRKEAFDAAVGGRWHESIQLASTMSSDEEEL